MVIAKPLSNKLSLSVLDMVPVLERYSDVQAVDESYKLAAFCESLGYARFWVSKHHNTPDIACATPEILVAHLIHNTSRIRVGTAGILLNHYSPLKVAEIGRMLSALAPGRIDLGMGRAVGSDPRTAEEMHRYDVLDRGVFREKISDVLTLLRGQLNEVSAVPRGVKPTEVWLLGSSVETARMAAILGISYCHGMFVSGCSQLEALHVYINEFRPSTMQSEPKAGIALYVACSDDLDTAFGLARAIEIDLLNFEQGHPSPILSPEEAQAYVMSSTDKSLVSEIAQRVIFGTPDLLLDQMKSLALRYRVNEFVAVTYASLYELRRESYASLMRRNFSVSTTTVPPLHG